MKALLALLCLLPTVCFAQAGFESGFDGEKTWNELQVQLPAYPKPENLLPFEANPASNNLHSVDALSISVGEDGVVRYSLVVKSPAGAVNVSYEGIRCGTAERRLYAFGRSDGSWAQPRVSKWEPLENVIQHYPQRALYKYFFCPAKNIVKDPEEVILAFKAGAHPRARR